MRCPCLCFYSICTRKRVACDIAKSGAALLLGYEEGKWPTIEREWPEWDELEDELRDAAAALGLDEDSWPPKPDVFALEWTALDAEQQVCIAGSLRCLA